MAKSQTPFLHSLFFIFVFFIVSSDSSSPSILRGIHPLDATYFDSDVIKCKDGSNSFTKDRLNDDFCDCVDGTDEPGTSACPGSKFYCRNLGSQPRFLFSSRVNDHICDCCDGSDEYDGVTYCPNTCIMGGSIVYRTELHQTSNIILGKESKPNGRLDMIQNLKDLKVLALLQLIILVLWVLWLFYRRFKSRKRRCHV
ncbi:hypothetical protein SOVF_001240 [Spinacia oleracea]|uniref:Glucosidase 2 subunit beta n=1 Tax=Spinacia oleracea TaxID=3562 RepID=A0A9R0J6T5_SPIOL|nr:glucosidase 2 subunit beta [Spinacia oleracea]KNA26009.1 hypothetical protein SOVF_001240 [Spinacia oleracea]